MSDKLSAKNRMAEMYPVKMAAGGPIGNVGILNAASMGLQPRLSPEDRKYQQAYNAYLQQYNDYVPLQNAWADEANKYQAQLDAGAYDVKVKNTSVGDYFKAGYYTYKQDGNKQILRPRFLSMVYSTPEPAKPADPVLPQGYTVDSFGNYIQGKIVPAQERAQKVGVALDVFNDPSKYNLAGFAGSSTFTPGTQGSFFAKGGEVQSREEFIKNNSGYRKGGDVKKSEGSKLDPVYVETEALRSQIEKELPKDKYFETYPVKMVNELKTDRSELAGVTYPYKEPSFININPKSTFGGKYGTFEHERQHLIDAKRGKTELRYPAPEYVVEDASYSKDKKAVAADKDLQFKTMNDINLAYQKHRKDLGLSEDFTKAGFFAEIRRIEKALPAGKSILDTDIGKDLFANNPELLQTYWSRTRPEFTTYMTEQRDSPRYKMEKRTDVYKETPSKSKKGTIEKVQDFIKTKTTY
jgi:hypothetical protein